MPNIHDIRFHIKSVRQTRQITNAMHTVSAARMRSALEGIRKNRAYFYRALDIINDILAGAGEITHPYLTHREGKKTAYIVVAGEKGLSGAYNHDVLAFAERCMAGQEVAEVFAIGSVASLHVARRGMAVDTRFVHLAERPRIEPVRRLVDILVERYDQGEIDELRIVHARFINTISYEPVEQKLLPLALDDFRIAGRDEPRREPGEILYEPSPAQVFGALVPQLLIGYIYGAIVHGFASENCSRMAAMESATRSADKMIEQLTQRYHTVRQLTITNELSDIIGAANAANEAQSAERASQAEVYRT